MKDQKYDCLNMTRFALLVRHVPACSAFIRTESYVSLKLVGAFFRDTVAEALK